MTLADLVPGGAWTMGKTDKIKVLKDTAAVDFQAVYIDATMAETLAKKLGRTPDVGWYKDTDTTFTTVVNDTPLPFGTWVLVYTSKANAYVTTSGEVVEGEDGKIKFNLVQNKSKMVGNCTPIALTLGNFVPGGTWTMGKTDKIKVIKDTAAVDFQAVYIDATMAETLAKKLGRTPDVGWYKDTDTTFTSVVNNTPIPAGCGIIAYTSKANAYIEIPSAL